MDAWQPPEGSYDRPSLRSGGPKMGPQRTKANALKERATRSGSIPVVFLCEIRFPREFSESQTDLLTPYPVPVYVCPHRQGVPLACHALCM